MKRAALLALENDRPVFSAFVPSGTTTGGETRYVPAGASTSNWHGRMTTSGQVVALEEVVTPGTPAYSYQLPSYEGSATMVKLWTQEEASLRGPQPADGMTDYQAEQVYLDLAGTTGTRWPDLAEIYEGVASRALQSGGDSPATPARVVAIRNYLKAATAHALAGRQSQSLRDVEQARALVENS